MFLLAGALHSAKGEQSLHQLHIYFELNLMIIFDQHWLYVQISYIYLMHMNYVRGYFCEIFFNNFQRLSIVTNIYYLFCII